MHFSRSLVAFAATLLTAEATTNGFNSGATFSDGSVKQQSDFEAEFRAMQGIESEACFNSVRLFTSIQGGSPNTPIAAIPAAIATKTTILLGLWASSGQSVLSNEIQAIQAAISQYGSAFTDLVVGISVGSEDLYRVSSIAAQQGNVLPGAEPSVLADYIGQVRTALSTTSLSGKPIGHVDTWTSWVNGTVSPVIDAVDFLGMDAYPYFESTLPDNSIGNSNSTFYSALSNTRGVSGGKPVWVTETGWPVSGAASGKAIASTDNAETYWKDVGCSLFGEVNTWWYILRDAPSTPSFGIMPSDLSAPLFNLSCPAGSSGAAVCGGGSSSSSSSSVASASATSSVASASAPSTTAASVTATLVQTPASAISPSSTFACNPAHDYGAGQSCISSGTGLTLVGGSATAMPPTPSSSAATVAPYPIAGTSSGPAASGVMPTGTGAAAAGTGSATASSGYAGPSYTGAANRAGIAMAAGFLAVLGMAATL